MSYRTALSVVLADVVAPTAEQAVREGRFPRDAVSALGRAGLLGLTVSSGSGGGGLELPEAVDVVARTARVCPATAAVLASHFAAVAAIESCGGSWVREEVAAGRHLVGLALREGGSDGPEQGDPYGRSSSVAARFADVVALRGRKRQVVAAGEADSYLWSSRPLAGPDGLTLWVVPARAPELFVPARPGGGGPRGSGTSTLYADPVLVPADVMLGRDGGGLDVLLRRVRPWLLELEAAVDGALPGSVAGAVGPGGEEPRSGPDVLRPEGGELRPAPAA
ncbi:acyl-CoA dehydrogenase family protein [Streptomyces triticiradicis]|uniref:Acyl-CoA dehydrogenase n=1 Tax=Streptomyces triticiradicis TaxID=2651189 RepID=A0A7J5D842_9ACTN|nr:acyl-CoA dehydrogenase family protein [Streptomyces triticiradicis]KAB1981369.1 acyl-CoA dehydrogenase [Streptomyces triticiradicis]